MDDIVEIARPQPFRQRPQLLREQLLVAITQRLDARVRLVGIWVVNLALHRVEDHPFVVRQIQLDPGDAAAALERSTITNLALHDLLSAWIDIDLERNISRRNLNAPVDV